MQTFPFKQADVFTQKPFWGNPVAVVIGAEGITSDEMQRIAAWTNLSETTFILPPSSSHADYRLRIFTPKQELPFAGHPIIGSAHAAIEDGYAVFGRANDGISSLHVRSFAPLQGVPEDPVCAAATRAWLCFWCKPAC